MKRIGLLGGSFDPVHVAHTALAQTALTSLNLQQVQLIPAAQPWQRAPLQASPRQRYDMLTLALADLPDLTVNPIEIDRGGLSYTIDTVRALPQDAHYVCLLGADQLQNFCTWRNWQEIAQHLTLAVAARPGASLHAPEALLAWLGHHKRHLETLDFTPMRVSSSQIRRRLAHGQPTEHLLAPSVAAYIAKHHLYR